GVDTSTDCDRCEALGLRKLMEQEVALGLHDGVGQRGREKRRATRLRQQELRLRDALRGEPRDRRVWIGLGGGKQPAAADDRRRQSAGLMADKDQVRCSWRLL